MDYVSVPIIPEILRAKVAIFADLYRKTEALEHLNRELERRVAERTAQIETAAELLRASEQRFRLLVENVQDYSIVMLDPDGRVSNWNTGTERLTGYREEEIVGHHFSQFFLPEDLASGLPARLLEVASTEGHSEDEGWRVRRDGAAFWADVMITALRDPHGHLLGFSKIMHDLSDRKRAEEERALLLNSAEDSATGIGRGQPVEGRISGGSVTRTPNPSECYHRLGVHAARWGIGPGDSGQSGGND